MPSEISPASSNVLGPAHRADLERHVLLHGPRGREEPGVAVELALEVDLPLVEHRAHHVVRLAQRLIWPPLFQSTWYWSSIAMLPTE